MSLLKNNRNGFTRNYLKIEDHDSLIHVNILSCHQLVLYFLQCDVCGRMFVVAVHMPIII